MLNDLSTAAPGTTGRLPLLAAIVLFAAIAPGILMTAPAIAAQLAVQWQLQPGQIGLLFSTELGALSLATLPAYWWLGRFDWRKVALLAVLVAIAGNLASAFASDYHSLLLLRAVSALAGGSLMILCISSAASLPNQSRVYGFWVMGQLLLGAIGLALLPALFERYQLGVCYLLLAGLLLLCLPLVRAFPRAAPAMRQSTATQQTRGLRPWFGIAAVFSFYLCIGGIWTFIGGIASNAGIAHETSGQILAIATLMGILGAASASLIGNRLSRSRMLWLGYSLLLAGTLLLIHDPSILRFSIAALLFKYTWTFVLPFILASLSSLDPSGRLMNTTNLVIGGGLAVGPLLAGQLIEHSGYLPVLYSGALVALLSLALILLANRRQATSPGNPTP